MNEDDRPIEESITTRKRQNDNEYSDEAKRRNIETGRTNLRFDFFENNSIGNADVSSLLEKLTTIKQQLNDVKSLLSD
ncbi:unnamed protein product, partial [Rotaria socialis]